MKEVVLAGLLGLILSSHLGAGPLEAQAYPKVTYFDKGKSCQLKLYGIKGFIHENDYFGETVKFRKRRVDRSLETLGKLLLNRLRSRYSVFLNLTYRIYQLKQRSNIMLK